MFLSAQFFIHINHKSLKFANLNCCGVLCWHSFVEDYGPTILYHPGTKISLPIHFHIFHTVMCHQLQKGRKQLLPSLILFLEASTSVISDGTDLLECFHNFPLPIIAANNPVYLKWIHTQYSMGIEHATKADKYTLSDISIKLFMVI